MNSIPRSPRYGSISEYQQECKYTSYAAQNRKTDFALYLNKQPYVLEEMGRFIPSSRVRWVPATSLMPPSGYTMRASLSGNRLATSFKTASRNWSSGTVFTTSPLL